MSKHDPLCPKSDYENARQFFCECDFIAEVRADELERWYTVGTITCDECNEEVLLKEFCQHVRNEQSQCTHTTHSTV